MSCTSSPTLTRTDQVVTDSLSTSTTSHVTTLPPSTTTFTLTPSCSASGSCTPSVIVSTVPGGTSTIVDTITITVPITSSQVTTLWGTSCSSTTPNTPPSPTSSDSPTSTPTSDTSQFFSTPPPTIIVTSSSSTQANGNVTPVILTITSTAPPVLVTHTPSAGGVRTSDNSKNLGPIIGGVVGGVVGLCALLFLIWFFLRRRQRWDDIFDNDDVFPAAAAPSQKEKPVGSKPQPYQYGLVGHAETPSLSSPPSSPPQRPSPNLLEGNPDRSHYRNNSATPLLLGPPINATTLGTSTSPRPPSSSSSALGYGSQVDSVPQNPNWDPNRLYNQVAQPQPSPAVPPAERRNTDNRAGSPVSFQERRILQVTNADLSLQSPQSPQLGSSLSTGGSQRDGKGRIMPNGAKAPIFHLDGGRYQEGASGSNPTVGTAPPAYSE